MKRIFYSFALLILLSAFFIFNFNGKKISYGFSQDLVINEIMVGSKENAKFEFIELFNNADSPIDLTGYSLKKKTKSGAESNLVSSSKFLGSIPARGYFLITHIENTKINNANLFYSGSSYSISADNTVILYDKEEKIIDKVGYGESGDFETLAAPYPEDDKSIERKILGIDSDNNSEDFVIRNNPTPGNFINSIEENNGPNATSTETASSSENIVENNGSAGTNYQTEEKINYNKDDILINEIFPDPVGSDTKTEGIEEFIELYNTSNNDIDLFNWIIEYSSGKKFEFTNSEIIKARSYYVVYRKDSKIILKNTGDTIKLYQPEKKTASQSLKYEKAQEGKSYNLIVDATNKKKWVWSKDLTPGYQNIIKEENHLPAVDFYYNNEAKAGIPILFDSSDTFDEDGDKLSYFWDFGDGSTSTLAFPEHTFFKSGEYKVVLKVKDSVGEVNKEKSIIISSKISFDAEIIDEINKDNVKVIITEILPNPVGSDLENEWLEIYNPNSFSVNLSGWSLGDYSGKIYNIENKFIADSKKYYVFNREDTGISLNNDSDVVYLYNNFDDIADKVEYKEAKEGLSFAKELNGSWVWTASLTPGKENIIKIPIIKSSVKSGNIKKISTGKYIDTTLEKLLEYDNGDLVKVKGKVAVLPGVFGVQYFYIVGSPGVQIYSYKKLFPKLKVGDLIEVSGEISSYYNEKRIKTNDLSDIKVINFTEEPKPTELTCEEINDSHVGELVLVSGEITGKKYPIIYIDDGLAETEIYIKKGTGIKSENIEVGDNVSLTGIVSKNNDNFRIMPRSLNDIKIVNNGKVMGETSINDEWNIVKRDNNKEIYKYLLILFGGAIVVLIILFIREKRKKI